MATAVATKSSASGSAGDVTVTKPTSLAVGDMMIAFICSSTGGAGGEAHAGPSGWTKIAESVATNGSVLTVWAIIATSTETAATDFSWTSAGTNDTTVGAIFRITGTNGFLSVSDNVVATAAAALATGGVTTKTTSTLLLLAGCDEATGGADADFTAYSVANNDPSWAEEYDIGNGGGLRANMGIASAAYPYTQATGSSSVTSDLGTSDVASALVAVTESINASASPAVLQLTAAPQAPTATGGATATVAAPVSITASPQTPVASAAAATWVPRSKPAAGTYTPRSKP